MALILHLLHIYMKILIFFQNFDRVHKTSRQYPLNIIIQMWWENFAHQTQFKANLGTGEYSLQNLFIETSMYFYRIPEPFQGLMANARVEREKNREKTLGQKT